MKTSFILIVISILLFCCNTSTTAQINAIKKDSVKQYMGVSDSLGYMTEIAANKQKYINQPLSVLIKDLKIPIKSFYTSSYPDRFKTGGMWINFDNIYDTAKEKWNGWIENPIAIILKWVKPLSRVDIETYLHGEDGEWTIAEQKYFSDEIVSDIVVPYRKVK